MKKIAIIGLGKMGRGYCLNLRRHNWEVYGYDLNQTNYKELATKKIYLADDLTQLVTMFGSDGIYILSLPHGLVTKTAIETLCPKLNNKAIIIDASNNNWKETLANAAFCQKFKIGFVDAGVSGGPFGAENGACIMAGGEIELIKKLEPLFNDLTQKDGFLHTGEIASGHFAKMIHNGIEYGMMQAISEGFAVLNKSQFDYNLDKVAKLWNSGSVIRSWLIELVAEIFTKENKNSFEQTKPVVHASGEGKWTMETALELDVPTPVIALSLMVRQQSMLSDSFSNKLLSQLRAKFGGHTIDKKELKSKGNK